MKGFFKKGIAILLSAAMYFSQPINLYASENVVADKSEKEVVLESEEHLELDESALEEDIVVENVTTEVTEISENKPQKDEAKEVSHGLGYNYIHGEGNIESITSRGDVAENDMWEDSFAESLPSSYTTPSKYLPPLRDQGPYETCWAHTAMAAAEISVRKQGIDNNADYSELHLSYFTYNTPTDPLGGTNGDKNEGIYNSGESFMTLGGNLSYASRILASWVGVAEEKDVPYSSADEVIANGLPDSTAFSGKARLKNVYVVSTKTDEDRNEIKRIVKEYGAAGVAYWAVPSNGYYYEGEESNPSFRLDFKDIYSDVNNCYYFSHDPGKTNHSVTIVGWNDSFSRNNFVQTPKGDGAWLIRNSWKGGGTINDSKEYNGYFWLSYYDMGLANSAAYGFEYEKLGTYDHNYQYDGGFNSNYITDDGTPTGRADAVNIFRVPGDGGNQILKAFSFETKNTNLQYTAKIYLNPKNNNDPESGELVSTVVGKTLCEGYYTVPLNNEVMLSPNDVFCVEVSFKKQGESVKVAIEDSIVKDWCRSTVSAKAGESFIRLYSGSNDEDAYAWKDVTTRGSSSMGNLCIKAFTVDDSEARYSVTFDANGGTVGSGKTYKEVYRNNTAIGKLPTPSLKDHFFVGWYTEKSGGNKITRETIVTDDATYYAHWMSYDQWVKKNPLWNDDGSVTYDCVWFGNYWQNDTNDDGKADVEDDKEPVKWRILSLTEDDLILISDKALDWKKYNEGYGDITWENSTIRSWLNGYGSSANKPVKDYSSDNFIDKVFNGSQKAEIKPTDVDNSRSQGNEDSADGGNNTKDKLYLLSLKEATTEEYGFSSNELFWDQARGAKPTAYAVKQGAYQSASVYSKKHAGNTPWWLRTPGSMQDSAEHIGALGCTHTESGVDWGVDGLLGVRPVLHISPYSPYLSPAGTVCSDGTVDEWGPGDGEPMSIAVKGVSLPNHKTLKTGTTITLIPTINPSYATNKSVKWSSSNEMIARVDENGSVTGMAEGTAYITVTTIDGGYTATCLVEVNDNVETEQEIRLIPGEIRRLNVSDGGKYLCGAKWILKSSDPKNCVSVKNGIVTANSLKKGISSGTAEVQAVYGSKTFIFAITVDGSSPSNTPIYYGKKKCQLGADKTLNLTVGTKGKVKISIPSELRSASQEIRYVVKNKDLLDVGVGTYNNNNRAKASKFTVEITPKDAGATYIVWSMKDNNGNQTTACTKVIIKKPLKELQIGVSGYENLSDLQLGSVGKGVRLVVTGTKDNTETKDLSFSFKGKGMAISKTGYLVAKTPGATGVVTVKCGKISATLNVSVAESAGTYLALNKTTIAVSIPKAGKKPNTASLKLSIPKNKNEQPKVDWKIVDSPLGITINETGVISVSSEAYPGCYEVQAVPQDPTSTFNTVFCELVVK